VSDGATIPVTAAVTVNVRDVNNNAPLFSPALTSVQLSKSVPVGFTVTNVSATDGDYGTNAKLRYDEHFFDKIDVIPLLLRVFFEFWRIWFCYIMSVAAFSITAETLVPSGVNGNIAIQWEWSNSTPHRIQTP